MHEKGHHAYAIWDRAYASEPQWQNHRYVDGPKVFENEQIHQKGFEVIAEMNEYIDRWSERQGFGSLDEFRGSMKMVMSLDICPHWKSLIQNIPRSI